MKNDPKTTWKYSNGAISIDPYRQKIIHQSGLDRHSDSWESVEALIVFLKKSTSILPFINSNKELTKYKDDITKAVEYFSSESYILNNETIFSIRPSDLIDYSSKLSILRKNKIRSFILYIIFILVLNGGIYLGSLLNDRIVYMFIVSTFLTIILVYTLILDYVSKPKFGKGMILNTKTGKYTLVAGKQVPSTSFFMVVGQQNLYSIKNNTIDTNNYVIKNNVTYQVSREIYEKYRLPNSCINFITKSKNEIHEILDSYL